MKRFRHHLGRVEKAMGVLLIVAGVLVLTGWLNAFGTWLLEAVPALGSIEDLLTPGDLKTKILNEGGGR
jgi:cytochrome c-type biogenesis protein